MSSCLFCDKYENGEEVVLENEYFYMQWDKFPISPGHAEVIPKRHVEDLLGLTYEEGAYLIDIIEKARSHIDNINKRNMYERLLENPINYKSELFMRRMLIRKGVDDKPDAYNFGINDGEAAGRTIHHLHVHIIPRYEGDVENPRGGVRHIIPGIGSY